MKKKKRFLLKIVNLFMIAGAITSLSIPFMILNEKSPAVISAVGTSLILIGFLILDLDKKIIRKRDRKFLKNQDGYYRESLIEYGSINIASLLLEAGFSVEERSMFAGIIMDFVNRGILEEKGDMYIINKRPSHYTEEKFLKVLIPGNSSTKADISKRAQENQKKLLRIVRAESFKEGYMTIDNNLKKGSNKEIDREIVDGMLQSHNLYTYVLTDKGRELAKKVKESYNFFRDFTMMEEKSKIELSLWGDYLVMATLYNMADKVEVDLEDIMPDWRIEYDV